MRRAVFCLLAVLGVVRDAYSFEVDGLRTGMTYAAAHALIKSKAYDRVQLEKDSIGAWDAPNSPTDRTIFLTFCKDRLVLLQKYLPPRFDHFVRLVEAKRRELGRPLDSWTHSREAASGKESHSVSLIWQDGLEFSILSFHQFTGANTQVDSVHQAPNDCWRTPFYGS
jgi:hypothetical protein